VPGRRERRLTTRDYRPFDIQYCVLPTRLPLAEFYHELVETQQVLNKKHLRWTAMRDASRTAAKLLLRGQTNFVKSIWKFNSVYDAKLLLADHRQSVRYEIPLPPAAAPRVAASSLYIHEPRRRAAATVEKLAAR
jgi:hypothetical protein